MIRPEGLIEGMREIGVTEISKREVKALVRKLCKSNNDSYIRLNDFVQSLEDFGFVEKEASQIEDP